MTNHSIKNTGTVIGALLASALTIQSHAASAQPTASQQPSLHESNRRIVISKSSGVGLWRFLICLWARMPILNWQYSVFVWP